MIYPYFQLILVAFAFAIAVCHVSAQLSGNFDAQNDAQRFSGSGRPHLGLGGSEHRPLSILGGGADDRSRRFPQNYPGGSRYPPNYSGEFGYPYEYSGHDHHNGNYDSYGNHGHGHGHHGHHGSHGHGHEHGHHGSHRSRLEDDD